MLSIPITLLVVPEPPASLTLSPSKLPASAGDRACTRPGWLHLCSLRYGVLGDSCGEGFDLLPRVIELFD